MTRTIFASLTVALGIAAQAARPDERIPIQARVFDIAYAVNEEALPLDSVELWYTQDDGQTWHQYGSDDDQESPVTFSSPGEGEFGFYIVLMNGTGTSGIPPSAGTRPHLSAFIDYTPPIVQLHPPKLTRHLAQRVVQIRWAAIDAFLEDRPVAVQYRVLPEQGWSSASDAPLANTGRFDWRLPDDLSGTLEIRVSARDRGGHVVESHGEQLALVEDVPPVPQETVAPATVVVAPAKERSARIRARDLLSEAKVLRDSGLYREGVGKLRKAVRLDPEMTDAFAEMAAILYRMKDYDSALDAYELALRQVPTHRASLQGIAMVYNVRRDYPKAAERLRRALSEYPDDAELWMNLGDVAVFQGDEVAARRAYQKAIESEHAMPGIVADARKRLQVMAEVSRQYR